MALDILAIAMNGREAVACCCGECVFYQWLMKCSGVCRLFRLLASTVRQARCEPNPFLAVVLLLLVVVVAYSRYEYRYRSRAEVMGRIVRPVSSRETIGNQDTASGFKLEA